MTKTYQIYFPFQIAAWCILFFALGVSWWAAVLVVILSETHFNLRITR